MRTLYLFTNAFPYGDWEPYLETEVQFYNQFDKVYIFSLQIRPEQISHIRSVPGNCTVVPIRKAAGYMYLLYAFRALFDKNIYKEMRKLIRQKRLSLKTLKSLFIFVSRSYYERDKIYKALEGKVDSQSIFYSYRFEYQPYLAYLLMKKCKQSLNIVSRAHGSDLYEERRKESYIPLRNILLTHLSKVYPCSNHGKEYLQSRFPEYAGKIDTSYLGTKEHGINRLINTDYIDLVSCSKMVPVKQIHLLVKALSLLADYPIRWTHFGDGPCMNEIQELSRKMLGGKIEYRLRGNLANERLLEEYKKQNFFALINVSSSEGLPVSIMEATSFGIPVIATDVGGTAEIVEDGVNGFLLPDNCSPKDIADTVQRLIALSSSDYLRMRDNARKIWSERFCDENNYRIFINELIEQI